MIEYNQKQSKEIYKALADSKVDLMEYFLGSDPKKTDYYKKWADHIHVYFTAAEKQVFILRPKPFTPILFK